MFGSIISILLSLLLVCIGWMLYIEYIELSRINKVHNLRLKVLNEDSLVAQQTIMATDRFRSCDFPYGHHPRYDNLPSFRIMVNKFWVKDLEKFLTGEYSVAQGYVPFVKKES